MPEDLVLEIGMIFPDFRQKAQALVVTIYGAALLKKSNSVIWTPKIGMRLGSCYEERFGDF